MFERVSWIVDVLEKKINDGEIKDDEVREILEDVITKDNVDYYEKMKDMRGDREDLCNKALNEVIEKRVFEKRSVISKLNNLLVKQVASAVERVRDFSKKLVFDMGDYNGRN